MGSRRRRVVWTDGARQDLEAVLDYIAAESREGAGRVLDDILRTAGSLATLAERGRVVPERDEPTVREVLVRRYRMLYRVTDSGVEILGVLHQRRAFRSWVERSTHP